MPRPAHVRVLYVAAQVPQDALSEGLKERIFAVEEQVLQILSKNADKIDIDQSRFRPASKILRL